MGSPACDQGDEDEPIDYEWPEQIFYYFNEELANLNRTFSKAEYDREEQQPALANFLKIVKGCLVMSKYYFLVY